MVHLDLILGWAITSQLNDRDLNNSQSLRKIEGMDNFAYFCCHRDCHHVMGNLLGGSRRWQWPQDWEGWAFPQLESGHLQIRRHQSSVFFKLILPVYPWHDRADHEPNLWFIGSDARMNYANQGLPINFNPWKIEVWHLLANQKLPVQMKQ